ncbi:MAG: hypothetical protein ACN6O6_23125 [Pseudomonas sp.]|uniref:hypothetical protein n=1 Tax=Pseudomonas sp. TaxID=306 RepID=UPI003D0AC0E7
MKNHEDLRSLANYFIDKQKRAKERLKSRRENAWHFGLIDFKSSIQEGYCVIPETIYLEPVIEPPGEIDLARALIRKELLSPVARYSRKIDYELVVISEDGQAAFNMAWWAIGLLRIKSNADFLVPVTANYSWSSIAGLDDSACAVTLLEDVPRAHSIGDPRTVEKAHLDWMGSHITGYASLLENASFRLAVDALTTHQHQSNTRMMVAMLWSGIEALFNIHSEISFRLAIYIATVTEEAGPKRKSAYDKVKKLYGIRSKAVHGGKLTDTQALEHILNIRVILSKILITYIEKEFIPTEEWIESELFGCH